MIKVFSVAAALALAAGQSAAEEIVNLSSRAADPCAAIAGQKWVAPQDVRACFTSFKVDPEIKANVRAPSPQCALSDHPYVFPCRSWTS